MVENGCKCGKQKQYNLLHDKEENWKIELYAKRLARHAKLGQGVSLVTIDLGQLNGRKASENESTSTNDLAQCILILLFFS